MGKGFVHSLPDRWNITKLFFESIPNPVGEPIEIEDLELGHDLISNGLKLFWDIKKKGANR